MRYYKSISNEYLNAIGIGAGGEEITEAEYNEIMTAISNKPVATETTDYQLKTDLSWEAYTIEPVNPEPTETDYAEVGHILIGD